MSSPSIAQVLIYTTAIGGITVFWVDFTKNAYRAVTLLANEMFVDEAAQDRERRRKIKQEVREEIEIERKILEEEIEIERKFLEECAAESGKTD